MDAETFIQNNWWWIIIVAVLVVALKGRALWKAAQNRDKAWFVAILILNTLGLLELFYLLVFSKRPNKNDTDQ